MSQLLRFSISNFRGIVSLEASPNGKSVTLRGKNGAGKSSAIDALWWALGGQLDGSVVRNGADKAKVEVAFGDYLITRTEARGKRPTLTVKSADGKATLNSPTSLLSGFIGAIERQTFSHKRPAEQAAILRKLVPGIDTSKLDAEYKQVYDERTEANREAKTLTAQADGFVVPETPASVPDDIDIVEIAAKKTDAERVHAENKRLQAAAQDAERAARLAAENRADKTAALERAKEALALADRQQERSDNAFADAKAKADAVKWIDTTEIDAEIARAKATNAERAKQRQLVREAELCRQRKEQIAHAAKLNQDTSDRLSKRLKEIEAAKAKQLADAKLPIAGLAIAGDAVTLDDGEHGPVEVGTALNTAARMRLDVTMAAALGHRLVAVRDASLLDDQDDLHAFAAERGIQLISEVVAKGEDLTAEIVEQETAHA